MSAKARARADANLAAAIEDVNAREASDGEAKLAARLGGEFALSADTVLITKQATGASWGDLMLALMLDKNSEEDVTAAQLIQLHHDGTPWGQISAGLGFKLGEVVTAARAETRVAAGTAQADGKAAQLTGGARVGVGPAPGTEGPDSRDGIPIGTGSGVGLPAPPVVPGKP